MQSVARGLGIELKLGLYTDSAATKGMMLRRGLGKMRHLEVGFLWLQEAVVAKERYVFNMRTLLILGQSISVGR